MEPLRIIGFLFLSMLAAQVIIIVVLIRIERTLSLIAVKLLHPPMMVPPLDLPEDLKPGEIVWPPPRP